MKRLLIILFPILTHAQSAMLLTSGGVTMTLSTMVGKPSISVATPSYLNIMDFNFKPDYEVLSSAGITIHGNNAIVAGRPFTNADIGKSMVVKNARSYPAYRKAPMTLNARVTSVSLGEAVLTVLDPAGTIIDVSEEDGWIATNNFDVMQEAIDSCTSKGKTKLVMNYTGTAYLVPRLSLRTMPEANSATLVVSNSLEIEGIDSSSTFLKWGMEDVMTVGDNTAQYYYKGFWVNSATLTLSKMGLISADRTTTRNDHQQVACIWGNPDNNTNQNIIIKNSAIRGSSYIYYSDANIAPTVQGWGTVAYMKGSDPSSPLDTCKMDARNSFIAGQIGLAYFSHSLNDTTAGADFDTDYTDTLNRVLRVWNTNILSGAAYCRKYGGITITAGAGRDTMKVIDPNFSFYDFNDYEVGDVRRLPVIGILRSAFVENENIGHADSLYWTKVATVINDSMAIIVTDTDDNESAIVTGSASTAYRPVPWNSTASSSAYFLRTQTRFAAFHSLYSSGQVGGDVINFYNKSLRNGRNCQNQCYNFPLCGSCFNRVTNFTFSHTDHAIFGECKVLTQGSGSGYTITDAQLLNDVSPQKY